MKCPFCAHEETKVVDSRTTETGDAIRRRRECLECAKRFTTYERTEEAPLAVVKKNGEREPFDRAKLLSGLARATVKRHVSQSTLDELVAEIESDMRNQFKYEVSSQELGDMILRKLKKIDKVAYVRFASVYREFSDLDDFATELSKLK
ncbi:MAG: transcriptional repressor NrdR [Actinobacteria bacterium]|nr:MAG: transcriptional repressor NrdR [Actinomycetota bacterium]